MKKTRARGGVDRRTRADGAGCNSLSGSVGPREWNQGKIGAIEQKRAAARPRIGDRGRELALRKLAEGCVMSLN